nr:MlaD family protein [Limobrevibacterium gyesilva]
MIAGFLGWRALQERGPTITITFPTADGLTAGQTKVRHKAVDLGTVRAITLSEDLSHVTVTVDTQRQATAHLTDHARFWVVRARLGLNNVSGLDTLLSGAYIEIDPGEPGGRSQRNYVGLDEPPAIRSDEPGRTFLLTSPRIGSISSGSPVFYRDINVGEVLGYDLGPQGSNVTFKVFVRAPFDDYVHEDTQFWNASGLAVDFGATGVSVRLESFQALLSGGVSFDTSPEAERSPKAAAVRSFPLYADQATANTASQRRNVPFITHFDGTVRGLAVGAPVELFGIQVGVVRDIRLHFDPNSGTAPYVVVRCDLQGDRVFPDRDVPKDRLTEAARRLVAAGLRAELRSANLVTGQMFVALEFASDSQQAELKFEDGIMVLPSVSGGLDRIISNVSQLTRSLASLPLQQMTDNLNSILVGANKITNGDELRQALQSLTATLEGVQDLVHSADAGAAPALKRLPEMAQGLQATIDRATRLLGSMDTGYGSNSQFNRDLQRMMGQLSDTARSLRLLADYIDQHPDALLRGRNASPTGEK